MAEPRTIRDSSARRATSTSRPLLLRGATRLVRHWLVALAVLGAVMIAVGTLCPWNAPETVHVEAVEAWTGLRSASIAAGLMMTGFAACLALPNAADRVLAAAFLCLGSVAGVIGSILFIRHGQVGYFGEPPDGDYAAACNTQFPDCTPPYFLTYDPGLGILLIGAGSMLTAVAAGSVLGRTVRLRYKGLAQTP